MKRYSILSVVLTLIMALTLGACDTSTDTTDSTLSRDAIITSVTLGTLKRDVKTTSSSTGNDTTLTYTVTGGAYNMTIDQVNYRIFNPDSLPTGTRVDKLVFASSGMVCSGTLAIKSLTTGNDTTFVPTDSTDFSVPREVTVYAYDGVSKRTYTVDIRVHKEESDVLNWQNLTEKASAGAMSPIASFVSSKAIHANGALYVFGSLANGKAQLVQTSTSQPLFNSAIDIDQPNVGNIDVRSIQLFNNHFFALASGHLVASATGTDAWETYATDKQFTSLVGCSSDSLYAVANSQMWASADGETWNMSSIDADASELPVENISATQQTTRVVGNTQMLACVAANAQGQPCVWRRDIDTKGNFFSPWMLLPQTEELGIYACPMLKNNCLFAYDEGLVLTGLTAEGKLADFYSSQDNGRTWKTGSITAPTALSEGISTLALCVDSDQYIWIFCSGTGEVFKGRINNLGW